MKKYDSINVIPFIDVMLVLLAMVLTTASFIDDSQLDIRLPEARAGAPLARGERIEIAIDAHEQFHVDGQQTRWAALGNLLDGVEKETSIVLIIDEAAPFKPFVNVIDELQSRGLDKLSLQTRTVD